MIALPRRWYSLHTCDCVMQRETKQRWLDLCAEAVVVEDPGRLVEFTREIVQILTEKQRRFEQVIATVQT